VSQEPKHRRTPTGIVAMIVCLVLFTWADLGTKQWALDHLSTARSGESSAVCETDRLGHIPHQRISSEALPLIDGLLNLYYAENCGAAFSMLSTASRGVRALVFGASTLIAVIALSMMFVRGSGGRLFALSVPLIMAGAIGNVSDRFRHGYVVDFLQVNPELFSYPIFNVADIWLAVGVALMLIDGIVEKKSGHVHHGREPTQLPDAGAV
jgi:signal peptidase II